MTGPIKNAGSVMALSKIFDIITKTLISHKARHITYSYDDLGRTVGLEFVLEINKLEFPFRLPARIENVERLLYPNTQPKWLNSKQKEQAYRVTWANIRDWIGAQMALIDAGQVKAEEVFLPYMVARDGRAFYEIMAERQFLLPGRSEASE